MGVSQLRFLIYVNIAYMDILEGANKLGLGNREAEIVFID